MPPDLAAERPSDMPAPRRPRRGPRYRLTGVMMAIALVAVASACGGTTPPSASPNPSSAASSMTPTPSLTLAADPSPTPSAATTQGIYAALDGMPTTAQLAAREPIALTIDDSVTSRPNQAGFDQASIVYQGEAEGGEMKYMMVFQEGDASRIGPLRSGRPHFAAWAAEYRAIFAHFGGDSHLLSWLPSLNRTLLYDISFIVDPGSSRDPSLPRPHNAFTSTARIREVAAAKGYPATLTAGLAVRPFVDDLPAAQRPTSGSIHVPLPNSTIDYTYEPVANAYLRSVDGKAEIDAGDGRRVTARDVVVLAMTVSYGDPLAEPGNRRPVVGYLGSGKAWVFHDGHVFSGTWQKSDTGVLTRFYDTAGDEIPLLRGRIFIQIVPVGTQITYHAPAG